MSWIRYYTRRLLGPYLAKYTPDQLEKWLAASRTMYMFSTISLLMVLMNAHRKAEERQEKESLLMGLPYEKKIFFSWPSKKQTRPDSVYEYDKDKGWIVKDYEEDARGPRLNREIYRKAYEAQKEEREAGRSLPQGALILVDEKDVKGKTESKVE